MKRKNLKEHDKGKEKRKADHVLWDWEETGFNAHLENLTWSGREKSLSKKWKGERKIGYQCKAGVMIRARKADS